MKVDINFDGIPPGPDPAGILQAMERKALAAAQMAKALWVARAQQLNITDKGDYIRGIQEHGEIRRTFHASGSTSMEITYEIVNTAPHASIVEDGHSAFHLPSRVAWGDPSKRVKRTKDGRPYLHIPFRHSTGGAPGATHSAVRTQMPPAIYKQATQLRRRVGTRTGPLYSAGGFRSPSGRQHAGQMFQAADTYRWQGSGPKRMSHTPGPGIHVSRSGVGVEAQRGPRGVSGRIGGQNVTNPGWKSSKYHGLMKTGPKGHSSYMTIRTMTPDSPGWNIPARAGHGVVRQVAMAMRSGPGAERLRQLLISTVVTP